MSKKSERREADRLARRAAFQEMREKKAQSTELLDKLQPAVCAAPNFTPVPTPARVQANRANAQHSTGPITEAGKAIASRNHTSHGLTSSTSDDFRVLPTEKQALYDADLSSFRAEWNPQTATEHDLVNRLVMHQWLRRRALRLQESLFDNQTGELADTKKFDLYRRYETQHERSFNKTLADLQRLRALQLRERIGFESQRRKNEEHAVKMRILNAKAEATTRPDRPRHASASSQSPLPQAALLSQPLSNSTETALA